MKYSTGSAHLIITIILSCLLAGSLGYIYWQNVSKKDTSVTQTKQAQSNNSNIDQNTNTVEANPPQKSDILYDSTNYSFSYPSTGWKLKELESFVAPGTKNPTVYSDDFSQQGMGVDKGAAIYVSIESTTTDKTFDEIKARYNNDFGGYTDYSDLTVGGEPAMRFRSEYEGRRYQTYVFHDGKLYVISFDFGSDADKIAQWPGYEAVVNSFKFK